MKTILITGAHGFLGRNTAALFKEKGYGVVGIGHGHWGIQKPRDFGIDEWVEADIDPIGLSHVHGKIDCVIHCAGGSSVGNSVDHPVLEFQRTVDSTIHVLEYIRKNHPYALIVYPSSAAVYGNQSDFPIRENNQIAPLSPYGFYKKIAEDLCECYAKNFDIKVVVIRFFSIYGVGLQKQLLWDACTKLCSGERQVRFYGTGTETRDWLDVRDAVSLIHLLVKSATGFEIFNGGSGERRTVSEILFMLSHALGKPAEILMGNENKKGDPLHYWADIAKAEKIGWTPQHKIERGLQEYVEWFISHRNQF